MAFNFKAAQAAAEQDLKSNKLALILLGSSGNGKSFAQGTFGCKTLYLYASGEKHGPKAARRLGGPNIIPVCIDRDDAGTRLEPDAAYERLLDSLRDIPSIKQLGIGAIAVDGASEIETIIRGTARFKAATSNEKSRSYDAGPMELAMFRPVLTALQDLQRELDVHYCMTCMLHVKEFGDSGEIIESFPALHGYDVATGLVQQFDDVMVIGRVQRGEVVKYKMQMLAGVSKTTKDFTTKAVRKTFNFSPRLTGVDITSLPPILEANLSLLAQIKEKGEYGDK